MARSYRESIIIFNIPYKLDAVAWLSLLSLVPGCIGSRIITNEPGQANNYESITRNSTISSQYIANRGHAFIDVHPSAAVAAVSFLDRRIFCGRALVAQREQHHQYTAKSTANDSQRQSATDTSLTTTISRLSSPPQAKESERSPSKEDGSLNDFGSIAKEIKCMRQYLISKQTSIWEEAGQMATKMFTSADTAPEDYPKKAEALAAVYQSQARIMKALGTYLKAVGEGEEFLSRNLSEEAEKNGSLGMRRELVGFFSDSGSEDE